MSKSKRPPAPQPHIGAQWARTIANELEGLEREFYHGTRWALMHAIRESCRYGVPLPSGLMQELEQGLRRFLYREVRELGEALGIPAHRKIAKWLRWHRPDPVTGASLFMDVLSRFNALEHGWRSEGRAPKRTEIKKQVAEEFRISPRSVDEIFSEEARIRRFLAAADAAAQDS